MIGLLSTVVAQGQIKIGGNVYGGGNHAEVQGSTKVTVKAGDIGAVMDPDPTARPLKDPQGKVFGGARMADVGGNTFVHIDGENASDFILINHVYGGNDIAGTIGTAKTVGEAVPTELTAVKAPEDTDPKKNVIDDTFNSYVRISSKLTKDEHYTQEECDTYNTEHNLSEGDAGFLTTAKVKTAGGDIHPDNKKIYIGQLFAGGNGDFEYPTEKVDGEYVIKQTIGKGSDQVETIIARSTSPFVRPELDRTYLEVLGGSIVYAYGGGNNATVKEQNIIHIDNPSAVVNHILVNSTTGEEADDDTYDEAYGTNGTNEAPTGYTDLLSTVRFKEMGINTTFSQPSSGEYQVGRFFGGNNKAEMSIRPTWNLLAGKVRNLYSGGNRGNMTSPYGLLLEIPTYSTLEVDNVFGGCRMADVKPSVTPCLKLDGYNFPDELSARTLVRGGHINNVYGGNDVTGSVYGGNAVGIYTTVYGDVYGGGNGNYPYTDNEEGLKDDDTFGDFFYARGNNSANSLNAFRPNAEQVSIRLEGDAGNGGRPNYTKILGSVYLGGNCASLATKKNNPRVELKIGSYVIADNVFLGNNGAGMVSDDNLKYYAGWVDQNGNYDATGESENSRKFSTMNLKSGETFRNYMNGVAMPLKPSIVFDKIANGDPANYDPFTSFIGSFYCGGNVGSMTIEGKETFTINEGVNIYEKFVGGCKNADVPAGTYNAAYDGGVIGIESEQNSYTDASGNIKDRIEINLENLTITPLRWNDAKTQLSWNTNKWDKDAYFEIEEGTELEVGEKYYTKSGEDYTEQTVTGSSKTVGENDEFYEKGGFVPVDNIPFWDREHGQISETYDPDDYEDVRLLGGNVYGGCYESGHVNGNVVININQKLLNRDKVFGTSPDGVFGNPASGVSLEDQRDDLQAVALSVFGAGYGEQTEIWGSTTVNHNNGYAFQIYGGGQEGVVGKKVNVTGTGGVITQEFQFDPAYSSTVNLNGASPIYSSDGTAEDLAETEYIYGGGNEGDVWGNTLVNLGNGRVYDAFGGACDADIHGHTEVIIGRQPNGNGGYKAGFPWVKDIVYGGNDFGGTIYGEYVKDYDYVARIKDYDATKAAQLHGTPTNSLPGVLKSASYVEYLQGRVDTIYGGSYGYYDYITEYAGGKMPKQESAFVNLRPVSNDRNSITGVFGAGTGYPGNREDDKAQDRSYILVDLTHDSNEGFKNMEVFGGGSYNGLGMREDMGTTFAPGYDLDKCSAIIDLLHGEVGNAYGGSYREGVTCRTVVNVPEQSTIKIKNIFGGAYGLRILPPCDVILSNVNYCNTSENALVTGAIYGGNNNQRRAIFTNVNISSPVWSDKAKGYLAKVYGAGKGFNSWSEHTHVEMSSGAKVYEVYGGGEMGHVLNAETVQKYMQNEKDKPSVNVAEEEPWNDPARWSDAVGGTLNPSYKTEWDQAWKDAWSLGDYYVPNETFDNYFETFAGLRSTSLVRKAEIDERDYSGYTDKEKAKRQYIYNTNVIINEGAEVVNYAYGGGYGSGSSIFSGDVWGHTYIALLGGKVRKDISAAGTAGAVDDAFAQTGAYNATTNPYGFTASATAYIKGGTCRNVYGGGWEGNVGLHSKIVDGIFGYAGISDSPAGDKPGETYVVIGDLDGSSFTNGIPAIQRNAYGGGEGGAVYGTANIKLNKGYIGYEYKNGEYVEKLEDDTQTMPNTKLADAGCLFGGGYIDNSTVDKTNVILNGGVVRNSVFGGGEIAAIGRGDMKAKTGGAGYELKGLYRPGKTHVEMYSGHVQRNVYGGGRGYDNLGRVGSLNCPGYIFGQTEVRIHGGEIGTMSGVADGDGNVFGGGDVGFVYSAYEKADGTFGKGVKDGVRYDGLYEGYYYQHAWTGTNQFVTVTVPTYYTAAEADKYNTDNNLTPSSPGAKKEGDQKGTTTERQFTEDCKVLVEPMCKVLVDVEIDGTSYSKGKYVPIEKLNKLQDKNTDETKWSCLDQTGIIIHNAVFAGGNAQPESMTTGANTITVFGNATASINDIYHCDLITLGTRHTGGLYGDGNLTLVDGYRELNITNYGTDYYNIAKEIDNDTYHSLPDREAAYYELNYTCKKTCQDKHGTIYRPADPNNSSSKAATITADDLLDFFLKRVGDAYVSIQNDASGNYVESGGTDVLRWNSDEEAWEPNPAAAADFWVESGVLPVYAGRLMNSIQRADLCGIFGSRMVMQGAQDRVPEEVDYTNYTINRVREVSLNKKDSEISSDKAISESSDEYYKKHTHGNYFGIYNVVNYLGSLTSDVHFTDVRKTDNTNTDLYKIAVDGIPYGTATYYDWKKGHIKDKTRNNANSHNKVALASGVYLEITTEESTGDDLYEKVWGPITGIVELDLINVSTGIGGGFVYAKNVHGIPSKTWAVNTTLTALNKGAATKWDYTYDTTDDDDHQKEWESSGNFVHSTQTIIDDCYNISNRYYGTGKMPAHFWYIKGSTYVYDQYISAYTGQSNAYSEVVDIPLTIAAASHGKMKLLNVMPNLYAYYASPGVPLDDGKKMVINGKTYYKNDPISYWDYYLLSNYDKELFVEKTYVNCITCKIDGVEYAAGTYVMTDTEFATYQTTFPAGKTKHEYTNAAGEDIKDADDNIVGDNYIFRESNNVAHDKGYILTYEVNNPSQWDNWYTPKSNTTAGGKITLADYEKKDAAGKALYEDGPTYRLKAATGGTVLGQREYKYGDLIPKDVEDKYQAIPSAAKSALEHQATFEMAYIVKNKITISGTSSDSYYNPGTAVSATFASAHASDCEEAYICTKTIEITKDDIIYKDSKMKKSEAEGYVTTVKNSMNTEQAGTSEMSIDAIKASTYTDEKKKKLIALATLRDELQTNLVQAYYCTSEPVVVDGNPVHYYYGGNYYESGHNYRGLEAWSSMSATDRNQFTFNYDALDLLIDPDYTTAVSGAMSEGHKYQYDSAYKSLAGAEANDAHYSLETSVDYTAEYNSASDSNELTNTVTVKRGESSTTTKILKKGDELSRDEFEKKLVNEQRHYAPVAVKNATEEIVNNVATGKYLAYVVNTSFQIGSTPYAVGETISSETYKSLPDTEKTYVTEFEFSSADHSSEAVYYYCRESYTQGTTVTPISSSDIPGAGGGVSGGEVQLGTLIASSNYGNLKNEQKSFTIHGISPTETSTLYVSRESDIYDLSKEKIITVIYQYDYDETDTNGNVTPISERHVVNIHLSFKSGVPTVEDITPPDIILPGDFVSNRLSKPNVIPGAYEVTGYGWELFATPRDAESHTNGVEYDPDFDPLYWYQDEYYVAYYAKSYLGRTYSNAVPVSVANYHDLKKVMDATDHHYYIDHKNVKRDPKIYINDYSASGKNGLDLFKDLYDLSLVTGSEGGYTVTDGKITAAESPANTNLVGHALLSNQTRAERNLEFFMRTDINHTGSWTPIGYNGVCDDPSTTDVDEAVANNGQCFDGVFHGDGHTISGLDHSLFNYLCGEVYNLGVKGSFTGAGIAEYGGGYVESCWVNTTGTPAEGVRAVFGNPSAGSNYKQVVNSYCQTGKTYNTTDTGNHGLATPKSDRAFYNGEVAYDLNNFYLYKRYNDGNKETAKNVEYKYYTLDESGNILNPETPLTGYYATNEDLCSSGYNGIKYVEDRFADGDYRFAAGAIPATEDERCHEETVIEEGIPTKKMEFYPIWPDDYIFFGQKLTYGYGDEDHQDVPTAVARDGGRLLQSVAANRVYRAPAYFCSKEMSVAHFNSAAYLAQKEKLTVAQIAAHVTPHEAYPGMTAIDFADHRYYETYEGYETYKKTYGLGLTVASGSVPQLFYPPLLDDDGLISIKNCDETQNLLVYAPAASGNSGYVKATTHGVLSSYFVEPEFEAFWDRKNTGNRYTDGKVYDRVFNATEEPVRGHLVQSDLKATNDHLLVDKQDFNCPIEYQMGTYQVSQNTYYYRMWYQRKPEHFVDLTKGWESISLPFTVELVSTDVKGELTHFYSGSTIGHEYWLREYSGHLQPLSATVYSADFDPLAAGTNTKDYTNTFLWDYYYSRDYSLDKNRDEYQKKYYSEEYLGKLYPVTNYPYYKGGTPYIIGFPSPTYCEFDLSGSWGPINRYADDDIRLRNPQIVTFASPASSNEPIKIGVSDDEEGVTESGLTFKPNYLNQSFKAGTSTYTLHSEYDSNADTKADCSSFVKVPADPAEADTPLAAFRPYFVGTPSGSSRAVEQIVFGQTEELKGVEEEHGDPTKEELNGGLRIWTKKDKIYVESSLSFTEDMRVVTPAGITVATFSVKPGKTVEVKADFSGMYIVHTLDGKYTKKVAVKRE